MFNRNEIGNLKSAITNLAMGGCKLRIDSMGLEGKILGVGFKPFWTNPLDSKIEKIEFNFMDNRGKVVPFYLYNIVGYDVVSFDGQRLDNSKNVALDIHVFSAAKSGGEEPYDKVRLEIIGIEHKK